MTSETGQGAPAAGSEPQGMVLTGRVEEQGLGDVLRGLVRSKESAVVTLSREGASKAVHVRAGRIAFASSSDPDDRLGECLLRDGLISVEQYEHSGRLIRPGKRQGTVLVELGYITPAELVRGVKLQVEQIVTDMLGWRQGHFRIEMDAADARDEITLNISTENLLFQGVKRGCGWSHVVRGLAGSLDSILERSPDADARLYKLDLSDDESHVVSLVNGRLSAAQICSMSYLSNHDTCLTLYALACCNVVDVGSARGPEAIFREQVAEAERQEIRALVSAFNADLQVAGPVLVSVLGDRTRERLDAAVQALLDEHWDALREASLATGRLDEALVLENVEAVEPGSRRVVVERALAALRTALVAESRPGGEAAEARVAAALIPRAPTEE